MVLFAGLSWFHWRVLKVVLNVLGAFIVTFDGL